MFRFQMRAAKYYGKGDVRLEEVPEPKLSPGKCIVEIEWCGICGSDLHDYMAGPTCAGGPPHVLTGETIPFPLGHEFCGRVNNPSPESGLKHGDPVMVDPRLLCRQCDSCNSGNTFGCDKMGYIGSNTSGGFAERCVVEEHMLHKLPDNIPLEYAAVIEPLAVSQHAIQMADLTDKEQKDVLILGGGPVGLALTIALKAHGMKRIVVSEPTEARRKQAKEFVDAVVNPIQEDLVSRCQELTEGRGVDIVFDCAGVPAAMEIAFRTLKLQGTYMNVAIWEKPFVIPFWPFMKKHIVIKSAHIFGENTIRDTIRMMSEGKFVGYEKLVTARIPLEKIVDKGFEELCNNRDKHIKILVSSRINQ